MADATDEKRFHRVDDELEIEAVSDVAFSPDGRSVVFLRQRPQKTAVGTADNAFVYKKSLHDLWVQEAPESPARNLTNGVSDQSGAWEPQWSPDGQRVAFVSGRGETVRVWTWDRATNRVEPVSSQTVEIEKACQWVDPRRLLCLGSMPGVVRLPLSPHGDAAAAAIGAWEQARHGQLTASVLDSTEFQPVRRYLYLLDVVRQTSQPVAPTIEAQFRFDSWWLAPDRRTIAVVAPVASDYGMSSFFRLGYPRTLELRALDGSPIPLKQRLPAQVLTSTLRWSPDGKELAFFAYDGRPINPLVLYGAQAVEVMPQFVAAPRLPLDNPARLYRVNIAAGTVQQLPTAEIDLGWIGAPTFIWTRTGELLFRAPRADHGKTWNNVPRRGPLTVPYALGPVPLQEWWGLDREGRARPLTSSSSSVPDWLETPDKGATFVGIREGDVFRVDPRTGDVVNLTPTFAPRVTAIRLIADRQPMTHLVMRTRAAGEDRGAFQPFDDYLLELASGTISPITKPSVWADLLAMSSVVPQAIYSIDGPDGLFLWRCGPARAPETLVEANTYRRSIKPSKRRIIEFTSMQGTKLKALLLLPPDYVAGRRYPLVVKGYSGQDERVKRTEGAIVFGYNEFETFGAAGYGLLIPEIPKNVPGLDIFEEGDSLLSIASAVVPATEQVVTLGIADPDRLFLFGFSFGGWTAASVLTQTTRYKAAVGASGVYYDEQLFGQTGAMSRGLVLRYRERPPHDLVSPAANGKRDRPTELPWWRDLTRIRRNSPLSYVDRIQTPLLLIHGDLDLSAYFEESEAMFNALASMRKRAQFVRYWGEGHLFANQANRRDYWQRILAWYDEFGDILRDDEGRLVFEDDKVRSRGSAPPLKPADFARFGPAAPASVLPASSSRVIQVGGQPSGRQP